MNSSLGGGQVMVHRVTGYRCDGVGVVFSDSENRSRDSARAIFATDMECRGRNKCTIP
jgi:hypothetical protein